VLEIPLAAHGPHCRHCRRGLQIFLRSCDHDLPRHVNDGRFQARPPQLTPANCSPFHSATVDLWYSSVRAIMSASLRICGRSLHASVPRSSLCGARKSSPALDHLRSYGPLSCRATVVYVRHPQRLSTSSVRQETQRSQKRPLRPQPLTLGQVVAYNLRILRNSSLRDLGSAFRKDPTVGIVAFFT
jgi:hypothetical protein